MYRWRSAVPGLLSFLLFVGAGYGQAPMRISGAVMKTQILTRVNPVYPAEAKAAGVSGEVALRLVVGKDGLIETVEVVSGPEMLRAATLEAVKHWTYKPYLVDGVASEVETAVTLKYTLPKPMPTATDGDGDGDGPPLPPPAEESPGPSLLVPPGTARISGGVMAGSIVQKAAPVYPYDAKAKGITGTVVMHAIIGKDGAISMLSVISGPVELRKSALDAVQKWKYKPYTLMGKPTDVDTTITVNYKMTY